MYLKQQSGVAHLFLVLILAGVIAAAGIGAYMAYDRQAKLSSATEAKDLPANLDGLLTADKVKALAQDAEPGTAVQKMELKLEDSDLVYQVVLANGKVLLFNAKTGAKLALAGNPTASPANGVANLPGSLVSLIGFDKARSTALAQKPGGVIRKIELESEEGQTVYSVRFADGGRVDINATTGAVVRVVTATTTATPKASTTTPKSTSTPGSTDDHSGSDDSGSHSGSSGSGSSGSGSSGSGHDGSDD